MRPEIKNSLHWFPLLLLLIGCAGSQSARFVLLPDTQTYAEKYPEIMQSQADWILQNKDNIDLVLQQGDLTQNNSAVEWRVIRDAFNKLDHQLPYVLAAGNHDMGSGPGKFADDRNTLLFNENFPYTHMSKLPGFGGSYEVGKMENAYYLLKTGKIKWLIITLEFGPRNKVLEWAKEIVAKHPDRTVIVNTHAYMYSDSTRQGPGDNWRPQAYGVGKATGDESVNDGEDIWTSLVRIYPNTRFVFSGHVLNSGVGTLVSINNEGLPVYQMLANYQQGVIGSENGGNGYLRILDMNFKKKTISVSTYSPWLKKQLDKPGHNFLIKHVLFKPSL